MKYIFLLAFLALNIISCKKDVVEPIPSNTNELISLNGWQLSRYTDASGKSISNSSLNVSAITLYGLIFEFKDTKETRAIDKITKKILNRGTWELMSSNTILDINIDGFKGQFKLISISKGKMTLQASTGNFLSGVGDVINMEFIESSN